MIDRVAEKWIRLVLRCKHTRYETWYLTAMYAAEEPGRTALLLCLDCGAARTKDAPARHWSRPQGILNVLGAMIDHEDRVRRTRLKKRRRSAVKRGGKELRR